MLPLAPGQYFGAVSTPFQFCHGFKEQGLSRPGAHIIVHQQIHRAVRLGPVAGARACQVVFHLGDAVPVGAGVGQHCGQVMAVEGLTSECLYRLCRTVPLIVGTETMGRLKRTIAVLHAPQQTPPCRIFRESLQVTVIAGLQAVGPAMVGRLLQCRHGRHGITHGRMTPGQFMP